MKVDLDEYNCSFLAPGVMILFRTEPRLVTIAEARNLLNQITDQIICKDHIKEAREADVETLRAAFKRIDDESLS